MFRLVKSETVPLTPELAAQFASMEASPTERDLNAARVKHLKDKGLNGLLVSFNWSVAHYSGRTIRMNGQHSSKALVELNGNFPQGLFAHVDTYDCPKPEDLALLFRQFDDRKSGRSPGDVSSAYQGIYPELQGLDKGIVKLAAEGIAWWRRAVQKEEPKLGDDVYPMLGEKELYGFIRWCTELFSSKTPELKKMHVVAAMFATYSANDEAARTFWNSVSRGGSEYEDQDPAAVLDKWLKDVHEKKTPVSLKIGPANLYQGSIFAWNAFRQEKLIKDIKFDTKKGYHEVVG